MMSNEVIIDGVNVAECKNFSCGICEEENKIPRTTGHFTADCAFYPNCYFKQLQRLKAKKQEKVLKMAEAEIEIEKLQAENEKLKETAEGLLKIQYALADNCNKYSKALENIKEFIKNDCIKCTAECDCVIDDEYCPNCTIKDKIDEVLND